MGRIVFQRGVGIVSIV